jgi:hypothetical protein
MHNFPIKTRQKKQEGRRRWYCPNGMRRLTSHTWGQNAQRNLGVSQKKKVIDMCHILKWSFIQKMHDKVLKSTSIPKMRKPFVTKVQPWGIFMLEKIPNGLQSLHFNTLTLSPTKVNSIKRWSKARIISFIGPTMCVLFIRDGKT